MPISPNQHFSLPTLEAIAAVGPRPTAHRPLFMWLGAEVTQLFCEALNGAVPEGATSAIAPMIRVSRDPSQEPLANLAAPEGPMASLTVSAPFP